MTDDQDPLLSEIQRLREVNRGWKVIAIAALVLVFVVMLPFTCAVEEAVYFRDQRYHKMPAVLVPCKETDPASK